MGDERLLNKRSHVLKLTYIRDILIFKVIDTDMSSAVEQGNEQIAWLAAIIIKAFHCLLCERHRNVFHLAASMDCPGWKNHYVGNTTGG
ncbi:hypothetical protein [Escherichia fergusonii]|uniref:hypothetical protein n=1 Tax=Escherichia fergusonii TaxID=564 RepID=UPI00388DB336